MSTAAYPLKLRPIYKEKVWGGRTLEQKLGRDLPGADDAPIGESWELVDLASTSASGGGGDAAFSTIDNGPLAGRTLHAVLADDAARDAVLRDLPLSPDGGFPILLKYLDANANLSVQVHPSPAYAAEHPEAKLKSEAWYIVAVEPGAKIYKGIAAGTTPDDLRAALEKNTDEAVVPLLEAFEVSPGECHYLPSGTCHALGGGILVAEVQTPSDTTFRVYDWGREGRELHVDAAIECSTFGPADSSRFEPGTETDGPGGSKSIALVRCEHFGIDRHEAPAGFTDTAGAGSTGPVAWMVLSGSLTLAGGGESVACGAGDTLLLPAAMGDGHLEVTADAAWLEVTFPAGDARLA
ncbi:type I phosphomannose isomerase catalytic subunit [Phycisphaera mikurensis]|uniref:Mannose-6-phosphate isomerase n=1 Tax=Phycisphaera mikurensis (strain NBRC 102666 / KCTC 22515 / FYK2301M01) TaxID=1142394 RepID=I0IBY6_PHYMF|nr:type I phosphomannose isomerase catalytic subunit [Phycisphaera mikurensis]MBB6442002.1 mannose-6-phosphate isomerase [Phycisphaera mikurensis]BAM02774.1 mannose-6-phosphate isomerase [Phycisphaera mikurensis NBRC 102666]